MLTHARIATIGGGFAGRALLTALFVVLLTVLATPAMAQTGSGFFDAIYVPNRDSDSISVIDLDTNTVVETIFLGAFSGPTAGVAVYRGPGRPDRAPRRRPGDGHLVLVTDLDFRLIPSLSQTARPPTPPGGRASRFSEPGFLSSWRERDGAKTASRLLRMQGRYQLTISRMLT